MGITCAFPLCSFTGKRFAELVSVLRWKMSSDSPIELFIEPQSDHSYTMPDCCVRFWLGRAFLFELFYSGEPAAESLVSSVLFLSLVREVAWSAV